jgi:putative DNA primase/helicase
VTDEILSRPTPLTIDFDAVPIDLRNLNQWTLWRYEWKEGKNGKPGKWDKPPYTPQGRHASVTATQSWHSFDEIRTAYEQGQSLPEGNEKHFDGIGFVTEKDAQSDLQLTLIDLDKCRDPHYHEIEAWAKEDLDLINSYSEISPSGTGIRIVALGGLLPNDGRGRKKGHVEVYQAAHYLTITGQRLEAYPATVEVRADKVDCFHKKHFCETDEKKKSENTKQKLRKGTELSDDEIIALATNAANGTKFKKLMDGDYNSYPSQSEADEALCCILAFYTRDEAQIERIWARSGLSARDKFQRDDYRERTIRKALETVKGHYNCEIIEAGVPAGKAKIKKSIATKLVLYNTSFKSHNML